MSIEGTLKRTKPATSSRLCTKTGIELVPAQGQTLWRVAQRKHGALNPPRRPGRIPSDPSAARTWNRWDAPGHRTIYTADNQEAAFAEVLSWFKRRTPSRKSLDLSKYFDDIQDAKAGVRVLEGELYGAGHMKPGSLPASWREDRALCPVVTPSDGWFINIGAMSSISSIEANLGQTLSLFGCSRDRPCAARG
jgi:RES domain-containing protein